MSIGWPRSWSTSLSTLADGGGGDAPIRGRSDPGLASAGPGDDGQPASERLAAHSTAMEREIGGVFIERRTCPQVQVRAVCLRRAEPGRLQRTIEAASNSGAFRRDGTQASPRMNSVNRKWDVSWKQETGQRCCHGVATSPTVAIHRRKRHRTSCSGVALLEEDAKRSQHSAMYRVAIRTSKSVCARHGTKPRRSIHEQPDSTVLSPD